MILDDALLTIDIVSRSHSSLFRDFGAVIEAKAKENGCTVNKTYCGHGINQLFHPAPNIPHYAGNRAPHYLKPGQVRPYSSRKTLRVYETEIELTDPSSADIHDRTYDLLRGRRGDTLAR